MRVLVACEFSGIVREAFRARGHDAVSCDLLPSEQPGPHIVGDVLGVAYSGEWDMMIAFPPCTHLAVSGARWWPAKQAEQAEALAFVRALLDAPIERIALENPIGKISTAIRKPDQIIQPHDYGHGEVKATCLWLKNLPQLTPTNRVEGRYPRVHREAPGPERWKNRSRTYPGIAAAMAEQWGWSFNERWARSMTDSRKKKAQPVEKRARRGMSQQPVLVLNQLTGEVMVLLRYRVKESKDGEHAIFTASKKANVTADFERVIEERDEWMAEFGPKVAKRRAVSPRKASLKKGRKA